MACVNEEGEQYMEKRVWEGGYKCNNAHLHDVGLV